MQNLTVEQRAKVEAILVTDRQWHRHVRVGHAKRMLKFAYYSKDEDEIAIRKTILRRLNYDWADIANSKIRE